MESNVSKEEARELQELQENAPLWKPDKVGISLNQIEGIEEPVLVVMFMMGSLIIQFGLPPEAIEDLQKGLELAAGKVPEALAAMGKVH